MKNEEYVVDCTDVLYKISKEEMLKTCEDFFETEYFQRYTKYDERYPYIEVAELDMLRGTSQVIDKIIIPYSDITFEIKKPLKFNEELL